MAKKKFEWDTEMNIGTIMEFNNKVKHEISKATLGDTEYVVAKKMVLGQDGWKVAKNQTFKVEVMNALVALLINQGTCQAPE
jgi:hypothetical protein